MRVIQVWARGGRQGFGILVFGTGDPDFAQTQRQLASPLRSFSKCRRLVQRWAANFCVALRREMASFNCLS
jgi:hypothetical protein